jgi:hypothetical protein
VYLVRKYKGHINEDLCLYCILQKNYKDSNFYRVLKQTLLTGPLHCVVSRQLEGRELFCLAGKGEEHGSSVRWDKKREKGDGKREVG